MEIEMVTPEAYEDLSEQLFNLAQTVENLKPNPKASYLQGVRFMFLREKLLGVLGKADEIVTDMGDTETTKEGTSDEA
jgi:hypothetical protein